MAIDPQALLATLTLEQKVSLLAGSDTWHTMPDVPGVPVLRCSDGPAGVRGTSWTGPHSASFPCGTALGATFDPELVAEVGAALGREARSKNAHLLLAGSQVVGPRFGVQGVADDHGAHAVADMAAKSEQIIIQGVAQAAFT